MVWLCFLLLLRLAALPAHAADVFSTCGGEVSISSSLIQHAPLPLDYSDITMVVSTKSGFSKERVPCAPDGSFIVPFYESGVFIIKPQHPDAWSFSPEQYEFNLSLHNTVCSQDIHFRISGFPLRGSVTMSATSTCSSNMSLEVSDIRIELQSETDSTFSPLVAALSSSDGRFVLGNLQPGTYVVEASHPSRSVQPPKLSHTIDWGASELSPFRLSGATVSGGIKTTFKNTGISMVLSPKTQDGYKNEIRSDISTAGKFLFPDVTCGDYMLNVDLSGATMTYAMNTESVNVEVGFHDIIIAPEVFVVTGISTSGRVVHASTKAGIDGVHIFVNSIEVATTDNGGFYTWSASPDDKPGSYHIQAFKSGYHFPPAQLFTVGKPLPVVTADKYNVCGSVQIEESATAEDYNFEVLVGSTVIETISPNAKGSFCFPALPGDYTIRSLSSVGPLSPATRHVTVSDSPVDNVDFYQLAVALRGHVACFNKDVCKNVAVSLKRADGRFESVNLTDNEGMFVFDEVAPESYSLSGNKDGFCFETSSVIVREDDITNLILKQTGVTAIVYSSKQTSMDVVDSIKKDSFTVLIPAEQSSFCVPLNISNRFQLQSCETSRFRFKNEPIQVTLKDTIVLELEKIKVSGLVRIPAKLSSAFKVHIQSSMESFFSPTESVSTIAGIATFRYEFWGSIDHTYTATVDGLSDLVFEPKQRQVTIPGDIVDHLIEVEPLVGRAGLFRTGKIIPGVPGAHAVGSASNIEEATILELSADYYRFGPLSDPANFVIEIRHPDYKFEPIGNGDFRAIKLCSFETSVVFEDSGPPAKGVLISLSGSGYRNNSVTNAAGLAKFEGLSPGQYYVFPLLKEFVFHPRSKLFDVTDDNGIFQFTAKRIAYSAFGEIKTISGRPLSNVVVSARAVSTDHVEETVSNADGGFRIRGLIPGTTYSISLKVGDITDVVERSVPENFEVKADGSDMKDIHFIGYRQYSTGEVFATLPTGSASTYVELRHFKTGILERSIACSPPKRFFSIYDIPFGTYVITASTNDLIVAPVIVEVFGSLSLAMTAQAVTLHGVEQPQGTSFLTILIGFAFIFVLINYEKLQNSAKKWNSRRRSTFVRRQAWNVHQSPKRKSESNHKRK